MKYECDKCGACCEGLIVEADELDVLREPRLLEGDRHYRDRPIDVVLEELRDEMKVVVPTGSGRCHFLTEEHVCSIYPTRPNVCVAMQPGDDQCQTARLAAGLPALRSLSIDA